MAMQVAVNLSKDLYTLIKNLTINIYNNFLWWSKHFKENMCFMLNFDTQYFNVAKSAYLYVNKLQFKDFPFIMNHSIHQSHNIWERSVLNAEKLIFYLTHTQAFMWIFSTALYTWTVIIFYDWYKLQKRIILIVT